MKIIKLSKLSFDHFDSSSSLCQFREVEGCLELNLKERGEEKQSNPRRKKEKREKSTMEIAKEERETEIFLDFLVSRWSPRPFASPRSN